MIPVFIWDFVVDTVLGQIIDWLYGQIVSFLSTFFEMMGNMGAELFAMNWVQAVVLFFSYFAWNLYGTGLVVSACEFGIEYQTGRASPRTPQSTLSRALWRSACSPLCRWRSTKWQ